MPKRGSIELRDVGGQPPGLDDHAPSGLVAPDAAARDLANRQKRQTLGCLGASIAWVGLLISPVFVRASYTCGNFRGMGVLGDSIDALFMCPGPATQLSEAPLRQAFRPPRRTEAQAAAMADIQANAARESAAAKDWALGYMGSDSVRGRLDSSLQHYSDAQLLDMWVWEMERMAVWHNAPLDTAMVAHSSTNHDDTPLNITLENGSALTARRLFLGASWKSFLTFTCCMTRYLQNQCQRVVLGGDQDLLAPLMVGHQFTDIYGIKPDSHIRSMCDYIGTLRESSNCMVFNSLNSIKGSQGGWNGGYGGHYVT